MKEYSIDFEPIGQKERCPENETILDCARKHNVGISSICGGVGTCNTCRIQITGGNLSEPTSSEQETLSPRELADGWRLACQAMPTGDCRILIPAESMSTLQRICIEGWDITVPPEPSVEAYHIHLTAPSLADQQADADRLLEAINEQRQPDCQRIDIEVLRTLSPQIRSWNWECQALVCDNEVIALNQHPDRRLGLAVDLGTTTIAGYLIDVSTGHTLSAQGTLNPQTVYGEDIISRINYVIKSPQYRIRLQNLITDKLNELASTLCAEVGGDVTTIVEVVVVGNTAMHHLSLGLPVRQLALTPFTMATSLALDIKARDLGVNIAPGAYIHFPPVIAGFVGSDHLAMLLADDFYQASGPIIMLDIGTNTEISLIDKGEITTTSCASGPAFEGGHIKSGMRAAPGAIERLRITRDAIDYQTIDEAPPVGICGSGALDAMAQLYLAGIIDDSGRLADNHPRVTVNNGQAEYLLIDGGGEQGRQSTIVITQQDIRELQLAKAAIRSGIQLLLAVNGLTEEQIEKVIVAGSFGSYIDLSSAVTVGLLPPLPINCFQQVGNAAGMGAKAILISRTERSKVQEIASQVHYIELASNPDFKKTFVETSHIGRYRINHGKREVIDHGPHG